MSGQSGVPEKGVLYRLLQARDRSSSLSGLAPQLPITPSLTPAKAGAVAIARAANDLYDLPMKAEDVAIGGMTLAELPEMLPESALLAILQGSGDAVGVMAISLEAVISLIEIQTINQVTSRPIQRRKATRADALMCADFINKLLEELGQELGIIEGFEGIGGFRYASNLDEPRPLQLILSDAPHRCITFQIQIGRETPRKATIFMALPQCAISALPLIEDLSETTNDKSIVNKPKMAKPTVPVPTLAAAVQDCQIEIIGILARRKITLGELKALQPGKVISLPRADLSKTRLELSTGEILATGKLGEASGCHAIRIADPLAQQEGMPKMATPPSKTQSYESAPVMEMAIGKGLPMDLSIPDDFLNPPQGEDAGDEMIHNLDVPAVAGGL